MIVYFKADFFFIMMMAILVIIPNTLLAAYQYPIPYLEYVFLIGLGFYRLHLYSQKSLEKRLLKSHPNIKSLSNKKQASIIKRGILLNQSLLGLSILYVIICSILFG